MTIPPDDLTEGWPPDPDHDALARFAEELRATRPALPDEALAWIEQAIGQELASPYRAGPRRLAYVGLAAALAVAAAGLYLLLKPPAPSPHPASVVEQPSPSEVHDRYAVELAAPPAPMQAERALVRLEEHRSLFTD